MTIKDIAQRCGVSISTVSRVLNNHPNVSMEVRNNVLTAMQEAHYIPNNSARDLVRPISDTIGLVVRGAENHFFDGVVRAVEKASRNAGYTMVMRNIRFNDDELREGAELVRSKRLRGLILLGGQFDYSPDATAMLGVPFVCCTYTNSFGKLRNDDYSSVTIDDREEAERAVEALIQNGHRKIAVLLNSTEDHSISQLRYMGYQSALQKAGVDVDRGLVAEVNSFRMPMAYDCMVELIRQRDDFTAIFAISDSMAMAAIRALHDCGKRVPEDCSVIAIDGIEPSAYMVPTLTTLAQPQEELGQCATKILVDMIEGRGKNCHVRLGTTFRQGESVLKR